MKSLLTLVLSVTLTCAALAEATGFPSEVELTSGRVLRRVEVVRWEKDRVVLKHAGGVDPVAFSLVKEPLRSRLPELRRELELARAAEKAAAEKAALTPRMVAGQVFVTTRGAETYRFGGARVRAYPIEHLAKAEERQRGNLPSNHRRMEPAEAEIAEAQAWLKALDELQPVATASTDADGRYEIALPSSGEYFLACFAGRSVGRTQEQNAWVVPVPAGATTVNLDGRNEWQQPE